MIAGDTRETAKRSGTIEETGLIVACEKEKTDQIDTTIIRNATRMRIYRLKDSPIIKSSSSASPQKSTRET